MGMLVGFYIFGSMPRGDYDSCSDIDLLAIYDGEPTSFLRTQILNSSRIKFGERVVLAEYSSTHLTKMFNSGHLFAWHLYQEAISVQLPDLPIQNSFPLGCPAPYTTGTEDAYRFVGLLFSILKEVELGSHSLVHEAGLAYLALRNIAMSLSLKFQDKADFSRLAPLNLSTLLKIKPPCTISDFKLLIAARHASQRGLQPPIIEQNNFQLLLTNSLEWANRVLEKTDD